MSEHETKPLKFEEAIDQLETIIERIESGEAGLEEALAGYEEGSKLIKHCRTILGQAEKRIEELTRADLEAEPEPEPSPDAEVPAPPADSPGTDSPGTDATDPADDVPF